MKKYTKIIVAIVLIAAFLRFFKLGINPPSLTWDEAAWGYNAYSLGIDGRDEFGRYFPFDYLESFGDFKPPLYAYLTIIPVKVFGLTEFAVRFSSALFGTLTVLVTYWLVRELFLDRTDRTNTTYIALLTSFFLAISPWHINLSRAAFEANVASFFLVCGVFLFLLWRRTDKIRHLIGGVLSFVLSLYTFNTARVVAPLLMVILCVSLYQYLLRRKKHVLVAFTLGLIIAIPFIRFALTPQSKLRYEEVNIFSDVGIVERTNQEIQNDQEAFGLETPPLWSRLLHNRRFAYMRIYLRHYFDHFKPSFLFVRGDGNPKFSTYDVGQLYLWDLPFLIIGVVLFMRNRKGYWWLVPLWLLSGIVPAATARETPHALRIEATLPTWQILIAYGATNSFLWLRRSVHTTHLKIITGGVLLALFLNSAYYLHGYYIHYSREASSEWQYGYKEAIEYITQVKDQYDRIVMTDALGRPYIYVLFHTKTDPELFRRTADVEREVFGFVHVYGFDKYYFMRNPEEYPSGSGRILYINQPEIMSMGGANVLKVFSYLNGEPSLIAYER